MSNLKNRVGVKVATVVAILLITFAGYQHASAQGIIGDLLSTLTGGQTVRIVSDLSQTSITSALQNTLSRVFAGISAGQLQSLNLKETVLDPIAWNMAKQLQQQLTGDLLKWLGGQQPGQNGQVPFVQDYGEHFDKILQETAGEFLTNEALNGMCSTENSFPIKEGVFKDFKERTKPIGDEPLYQCGGEDANKPGYQDTTILGKVWRGVTNCNEDSVTCATFNAKYELAKISADKIKEEERKLNISKGMLEQKVCKTVNLPSGGTKNDCKIVSPLNLAADTVSFQLGQLPSLQLLQMDEFNEIVSNLMSNLTNQALGGLNGVLGLTNNPDYGLVFDPNGGLSYLDALLQDDISININQSAGSSPIKASLAAEQRHLVLQTFVLNEVVSLESQIASSSCSLPLSDKLVSAKTNASAYASSAISASGTIPFLTMLDNRYDNATTTADKNNTLNVYMQTRSSYKTEADNLVFDSSFIDWDFCSAIDQFKLDMSSACGIGGHTAGTTCGPNWGP